MAVAHLEFDMVLDTIHDRRARFIERSNWWAPRGRPQPLDEDDSYRSGDHYWEIPTWEWHHLGQPVGLTVAVSL